MAAKGCRRSLRGRPRRSRPGALEIRGLARVARPPTAQREAARDDRRTAARHNGRTPARHLRCAPASDDDRCAACDDDRRATRGEGYLRCSGAIDRGAARRRAESVDEQSAVGARRSSACRTRDRASLSGSRFDRASASYRHGEGAAPSATRDAHEGSDVAQPGEPTALVLSRNRRASSASRPSRRRFESDSAGHLRGAAERALRASERTSHERRRGVEARRHLDARDGALRGSREDRRGSRA